MRRVVDPPSVGEAVGEALGAGVEGVAALEDGTSAAEQAAATSRIPVNASDRDPRVLNAAVLIVDPPIGN